MARKTEIYKYDLLGEKVERIKVSRMISKILKSAAKRIKKIGASHRLVGIGDTQTDEAIASYFYKLIHKRG